MSQQKRKDLFEIKGIISEALPNMMYRAEITEGPEQLIGKTVLCTLNGNMRRFSIRVLPGDSVIAEMSVYDANRARITRRLREGQVQEIEVADQEQVLEEEVTTIKET